VTRVETCIHSPAPYYFSGNVVDGHHRMILDGLLARFEVRAGHRIVEVGAGSGRYTEALLARGARVIVIEPDAALVGLLHTRLGDHPGLDVRQVTVGECGDCFAAADLVCGFHVLHHLTHTELGALAAKLHELTARVHPRSKGWFFLEPNPLSPLYPLQIALSSAMRWREERGIWNNDYAVLGSRGTTPWLGNVGLFPPRPWVDRMPDIFRRSGATLSHLRSPVHCYTVYGEVCGRG
jgi:SAM-dependent methyltransferase